MRYRIIIHLHSPAILLLEGKEMDPSKHLLRTMVALLIHANGREICFAQDLSLFLGLSSIDEWERKGTKRPRSAWTRHNGVVELINLSHKYSGLNSFGEPPADAPVREHFGLPTARQFSFVGRFILQASRPEDVYISSNLRDLPQFWHVAPSNSWYDLEDFSFVFRAFGDYVNCEEQMRNPQFYSKYKKEINEKLLPRWPRLQFLEEQPYAPRCRGTFIRDTEDPPQLPWLTGGLSAPGEAFNAWLMMRQLEAVEQIYMDFEQFYSLPHKSGEVPITDFLVKGNHCTKSIQYTFPLIGERPWHARKQELSVDAYRESILMHLIHDKRLFSPHGMSFYDPDLVAKSWRIEVSIWKDGRRLIHHSTFQQPSHSLQLMPESFLYESFRVSRILNLPIFAGWSPDGKTRSKKEKEEMDALREWSDHLLRTWDGKIRVTWSEAV